MLIETCQNCSTELRTGSAFCPKCGTRRGEHAPDTVEAPTGLIPNNHWEDFKDILRLYALFLSASLIFYFILKLTDHPMVEVCYWITDIILITVIAYRNEYGVTRLFTSIRIEGADALKMAAALLAGWIAVELYFKGMSMIGTVDSNPVKNIVKHGWPLWTAYLLTAVCPGILEEIAFRGIIYAKLKQYFTINEALFIQAACFAILHLNPTIFISHLIMGMVLGYLREKSSSLWPSMFVHMAWNGHIIYLALNK